MHDDAAKLSTHWIDAACNPQVAAGLEAIYLMIADQIEARGPACWASGRCCNFAKTGHRLYATGLETAFLVHRLERAVRPSEVSDAVMRGDCPFLNQNLCTVHGIKPVGCRVYFCDAWAQDWQEELSERALSMVRTLHERHAIEYRYGEWRSMLGMFTSDSTQPGL
ncbi:MAG: YkgJ family cysteine cluster protein [Planctomycetota bacterium]|nr:YkgJ family cysteine cluster protein [Planctomycetota bacterium]